MSDPPKTTYKTTNRQSYDRTLRYRGSLSVWFDASIQWELSPSGRRGRQQSDSDAAIQTCLVLKVSPGLPLRQTTGFVANLLDLSGLDWSVPAFSTLSRRQKIFDMTIPYRDAKGPLHLLIDNEASTAVASGRSDRWRDRWQLRRRFRMA